MQRLIEIFFHLDKELTNLAEYMGPWLYVLLFAIIFAETGLVILPFLPGDSLLFAVGALAAADGSPINVWLVCLLMWVAAVIGDAVNYAIGKRVGPKVFSRSDSRWLNKAHLLKAQAFYEKYGGKTIIIARFVPIIRTFAPFVAGIGTMRYSRFALFNVGGGAVWVILLTFAGYFFGNLEVVKKNFQYVIIAIIVISILPAVIEVLRARRAEAAAKA